MRIASIYLPFLALFVPLAVYAAKSAPTDSTFADGDLGGIAIVDDVPYENVENPGAAPKAGWMISGGYTGSRAVNNETYQGQWSSAVSKSWYFASLTPSLKMEWLNDALDDQQSNSGTFVAGLNWAVTTPGSFYLQGAWTTQEGPDEPSATLGTWWELPLGEVFSTNADGSVGWSKSADLDGHAGAGLAAEWERASLEAGAGWEYRKLEFYDVAGKLNSRYHSVWSAQAGGRVLWGTWSTGPSWSMQYWKLNASAKMPKSKAKIQANGSAMNQTLAWNLGWEPLLGWSLDVSGFRTLGETKLSGKKTDPPQQQQKVQAASSQFYPSEDCWGASLDLSISW